MAALANGSLLSSAPSETLAYQYIIDSYRLRVEDEYAFGARNIGLYGEDDPLPPFRRYLDRMEKASGGTVLPAWWNQQKRRECVRKATREKEWCCIRVAVEKGDIQEHYGDNLMPMALRMLAEEVLGYNVMGMGKVWWESEEEWSEGEDSDEV